MLGLLRRIVILNAIFLKINYDKDRLQQDKISISYSPTKSISAILYIYKYKTSVAEDVYEIENIE